MNWPVCLSSSMNDMWFVCVWIGLDNLHEYLKFSYPRMRAPSFFCENETSTGLTLHYRSKRRGFVHYTMGQIKQVIQLIIDSNRSSIISNLQSNWIIQKGWQRNLQIGRCGYHNYQGRDVLRHARCDVQSQVWQSSLFYTDGPGSRRSMPASQSIHLYRHLSVLHPFWVNYLIYTSNWLHASSCLWLCVYNRRWMISFPLLHVSRRDAEMSIGSITGAIVRRGWQSWKSSTIITKSPTYVLPWQYIREVISRFISNECALNVTYQCNALSDIDSWESSLVSFLNDICVSFPMIPAHIWLPRSVHTTVHRVVMLWWCYRFFLQCPSSSVKASNEKDHHMTRFFLWTRVFSFFPFHVCYTYWMFDGMIRSDMIIRNIGNSLAHILPELIGQDISEVFDLTRPLVDFKFSSVRFRYYIFPMNVLITCIPLIYDACVLVSRYWNELTTSSNWFLTSHWQLVVQAK